MNKGTFFLSIGSRTHFIKKYTWLLCGVCILFSGIIHAQTVKGTNVNYVKYSGSESGSFKQTGDKTWAEYKSGSNATHATLTEQQRDEWSVYLKKNDGANIQLDLHTKKIYYNRNFLYNIIEVKASPSDVDFYFTPPNGWSTNHHVRTLGDINGDGKADIVGFGGAGVFVSFTDGNDFTVPQLLVKNFAINAGGWDVSKHTRVVADVNGDGKDDIVGFGGGAVFVSLSLGKTFSEPKIWLNHYFSTNNGWNNKEHVRTVADVNGDGKADLVGFGGAGVFVSLSTGSSFPEPQKVVNNYAIGAGGWLVDKHTRLLGDIDGDRKADIIGFGGSVFTSISQGYNFGSQTRREDQAFYINPNWWNLARHRRMLADVNGDNKADIVGFTESKVYVSLANGNGFNTKTMCFENFTYSKGWQPSQYPIAMGDINGDGKDDIIGFKDNKVFVAYSNGSCFNSPRSVKFY